MHGHSSPFLNQKIRVLIANLRNIQFIRLKLACMVHKHRSRKTGNKTTCKGLYSLDATIPSVVPILIFSHLPVHSRIFSSTFIDS